MRRFIPEDLSNVEFETSEEVQVVPTFDGMGLREDLLRGIYAYGMHGGGKWRISSKICRERRLFTPHQSPHFLYLRFYFLSFLLFLNLRMRVKRNAEECDFSVCVYGRGKWWCMVLEWCVVLLSSTCEFTAFSIQFNYFRGIN